ncbi:UNVERIFIED_CONTAM: hypothetical protein HDU68_012089 [Siphonaria sp. JEL0065]|nr:hypothetical protein HDU68_012089 [Siphonaria sp. JEL0065]
MLYDFIRNKTFGLFATPSTIGILGQIIIAYFWGEQDKRIGNFCIVIPTICIGFMWFGTVMFAERNAIAQMSRDGRGKSPEAVALSEAEWANPGYRAATNFMCVVWGVGFILQATVIALVAFLAPQSAFNATQIGLGVGVPVALGTWNYFYVQELMKKKKRAEQGKVGESAEPLQPIIAN